MLVYDETAADLQEVQLQADMPLASKAVVQLPGKRFAVVQLPGKFPGAFSEV